MRMVARKQKPCMKEPVVANDIVDDDMLRDAPQALRDFVKPGSLRIQLESLKKFPDSVRSVKAADGDRNLNGWLTAMCMVFKQCPAKHQLRRAIASSLKGVEDQVQSIAKSHFSLMVSSLCPASLNTDEIDLYRNSVDTIGALMDNFQIGEFAVAENQLKVLNFVSKLLEILLDHMRVCDSPVERTLRMHDCHASTQFATKLLQRMISDESNCYTSSPTTKTILSELAKILACILNQDQFMLDCMASCSMCIVLIWRLLYQSQSLNTNTAVVIYNCLCGPLDTEPASLNLFIYLANIRLQKLVPNAAICFLHGILAMVTPSDLCVEVSRGQTLLEVIAIETLALIEHGLDDSSAKLVASKSLVLWSNRAREVLVEKNLVRPSWLEDSLRGSSDICQRLIDYAWSHWEHPVDALRHQARILFDSLVQCHLAASHEEPMGSEFLQKTLASLLDMDWHVKGKYGPLCCIIEQTGVMTLLTKCPDVATQLLSAISDQTLACYVSELYEKIFSAHQRELAEHGGDSPGGAVWLAQWVDPVITVLCGDRSSAYTHVNEYILPKLLKRRPGCLQYMVQVLSQTESIMSDSASLGALVTCLKQAQTLGILCNQNTTNIAMETTDDKNTEIWLREERWNGVVPLCMLGQALRHANEQVRLDALALLCDHHKSTQPVSLSDFDLLTLALPLNLASQTPSFRQHLVSLLKKLLGRLRESYRLLEKARDSATRKGEDISHISEHLSQYKSFVTWLCTTLLHALHVGAGFPQRTTALTLLSTIVKAVTSSHHSKRGTKLTCEELDQCVLSCFSVDAVNVLLHSLVDTFEDNKEEVLCVLSALPVSLTTAQPGLLSQRDLLQVAAISLIRTTRPQDSVTASYILKTLLLSFSSPLRKTAGIVQGQGQVRGQDDVEGQSCEKGQSEGKETDKEKGQGDVKGQGQNGGQGDIRGQGDGEGQSEVNCYLEGCVEMVEALVDELRDEVMIARSKGLLHVAATRPLYPVLLCLRQILSSTALRDIKTSSLDHWGRLIRRLIELCFEVAVIVSPVVSNSSPEGNVPLDAITDAGIAVDTTCPEEDLQGHLEVNPKVISNDKVTTSSSTVSVTNEGQSKVKSKVITDDDDDVTASASKVSLMPEYLIVCCWRTIKEVSLLLGLLMQRTPITHGDIQGLLDTKQVYAIGEYFTTQLLESRHRGAFELAYAGFVKMTERLWKCTDEGLHTLPDQWLEELMNDVRSTLPNSRLCATRRSAGVPFYIQAIVSTEPIAARRKCLKRVMSELLKLAQPPVSLATGEDASSMPRVHALNILRALYRDSRLGDDVFSFVAEGMKQALMGYAEQDWAVRNSSSLLFSALMQRIFGVKRTKDEFSKKNQMTGRVFFKRFPELFAFLLSKLTEATADITSGTRGRMCLHPGLYPVLMILGRLFPSVVEGTDTSLNLAQFIPHVIKCAGSAVYKTRMMAARAIRPLVAKDQISNILTSLFDTLPVKNEVQVQQNLIHGLLLQISHLLMDQERLPRPTQLNIMAYLPNALRHRLWLASKENPCLLTRTVFIEICQQAFIQNQTLSPAGIDPAFHELLTELLDIILSDIIPSSLQPVLLNMSTPYYSQHQEAIADLFLLLLSPSDNSEVILTLVEKEASKFDVSSISQLFSKLLCSPCYEVKIKSLDFLLANLVDSCSITYHEGQIEVRKDRIFDVNDIFAILVGTVMMKSNQCHPEILVKSLQLLPHVHKTKQLPWKVRGNEFSLLEIMSVLHELEESSREDVCCAALTLASHMMPLILQTKQQLQLSTEIELAGAWCRRLEDHSSPLQTNTRRLTAAKIISTNTEHLLVDPEKLLGDSVLSCWTCVIRLLQDEDEEVRHLAAKSVLALRPHLPGSLSDLCVDEVEASLALDLCLSAMIALHSHGNLPSLLRLLVTWVERDLQPSWPDEEREVRLFDKGELNSYHDEMKFSQLVAKHLSTLLCENNIASTNKTSILSCKQFLGLKSAEIALSLDENWASLAVMLEDGGSFLLQQGPYQNLVMTVGRHTMLMEILMQNLECINDDVNTEKLGELVNVIRNKLRFLIL